MVLSQDLLADAFDDSVLVTSEYYITKVKQ